MKKMLFATVPGLALVALALPTSRPAADEPPGGKEIFLIAKCEMCHSVPSLGITAKVTSDKMKGPDIAGVSGTPAELASYLRLQSERNGKLHQKEFRGTEAELKALVAWVLEQKPK